MTDRHKDLGIAAAVGALMFVLYAMLAPTALCGADNAEFVTLSVQPGIAHPPGYPLYTVYLRATSWLMGATPAHTAAIATSILGGLAVALLALGGMRWKFPRSAAVLGALLVGVELHVLKSHTHAEVFALNNLIAAAILCVAAPRPTRPTLTAAALGLLAGLGLSNHHSIVLMAPVGLWGLWHAVRASERRVLTLLAAIACGLLGLLPYATLLFSPDCVDCMSWGAPTGPGDLIDHFLRTDYGTTSLGVSGETAPLVHLAALGKGLAVGSWLALPLMGIGGAVVMYRRDRRTEAGVLGATFLLCGPLFVALFNTVPEGIGADIVGRFYALPVITTALFVIAALSAVGPRLRIASAAVILVLALTHAEIATRQCTGVIDSYARDLLHPLPQDAVIFGTGDHRTFGTGYMQTVEGVRPDVDWVDARLLAHAWYVERLEARLGRRLPRSTATQIPLTEFIAAAHVTGRPVFVSHMFADTLRSLPTYPIGPVIRVLPSGAHPPQPTELATLNADLQLSLDVPRSSADNPWEREVFQHYARPWRSLVRAFELLDDKNGARQAAAMATVYE